MLRRGIVRTSPGGMTTIVPPWLYPGNLASCPGHPVTDCLSRQKKTPDHLRSCIKFKQHPNAPTADAYCLTNVLIDADQFIFLTTEPYLFGIVYRMCAVTALYTLDERPVVVAFR